MTDDDLQRAIGDAIRGVLAREERRLLGLPPEAPDPTQGPRLSVAEMNRRLLMPLARGAAMGYGHDMSEPASVNGYTVSLCQTPMCTCMVAQEDGADKIIVVYIDRVCPHRLGPPVARVEQHGTV